MSENTMANFYMGGQSQQKASSHKNGVGGAVNF